MTEKEKAFKKTVLSFYRKNRRDFPWRRTTDPYRILVSEIMLQQTQTDRVAPKFEAFIRKFPTARVLAKAPLGDVLSHWNGLGYNRRAKHLHEAAKVIVSKHGGKMPGDVMELRSLPGVGPYIAGAVTAFAFDMPAIFIETNIRTAITHYFFPARPAVRDAELLPILESLNKSVRSSREWYSALMDYGAYLKRNGVRINDRNPTYKKQSKFEGSDRQIRGKILSLLKERPHSERLLLRSASSDHLRAKTQLQKLIREGMVSKNARTITLG